MRRALELAPDHPRHLAQFGPELLLRVQAAGGVDDDHVHAAGGARGDRVEGHRARILALAPGDDVAAGPLGPALELLHRRRAVGVGGADQDRVAELLAQVPGQLADRRRLAGAVDPDHQHHRGLVAQVDAVGAVLGGPGGVGQ